MEMETEWDQLFPSQPEQESIERKHRQAERERRARRAFWAELAHSRQIYYNRLWRELAREPEPHVPDPAVVMFQEEPRIVIRVPLPPKTSPVFDLDELQRQA